MTFHGVGPETLVRRRSGRVSCSNNQSGSLEMTAREIEGRCFIWRISATIQFRNAIEIGETGGCDFNEPPQSWKEKNSNAGYVSHSRKE